MSTTQGSDPYKYQWARYVAREKLESDFQILRSKLSDPSNNTPVPSTLSEFAFDYFPKSEVKKFTGPKPSTRGKFKVGIVGAGCSGLFTAMIIDFLNKKIPGLDIKYDILEAAGEDRLGGRLYTHKFSEKEHDYYDVGAMRFPKNKIMERTFHLFEHLKLTTKLIPYYLEDHREVCPTYFNDKLWVGPPTESNDPYKINEGLPDHDKIPEELINQRPSDVIDTVIKEFKVKLKDDLDSPKLKTEGWDMLMKADFMSTRQFFYSKENKDLGIPPGPGLSFNTVEWLETFAYATGWYNQSLSETVLESLDFDVEGKTSATDTRWSCLDGGTQQVAIEMAKKLKKQPEFNTQVSAIAVDKEHGTLKLSTKRTDGSRLREQREYFAVFNSTTLGALQRMDLTEAGLLYGTKQAIRSLSYGASCKVGMKFKTAWWMKEPHNINLGGIAKTDLPLRVCVYPSYNVLDDKDKSAVLLCSYTWAQDAQRIGSLISPDSPDNEEDLKEVLFHNLALLHSIKDNKDSYNEVLDKIKEQYITHHAYDWYNDNNQSGAFAYFGPGQFSSMWPEITKQNGWLFFIGEAASAHHAWIVGALESSVRAVYQMLESLHLQDQDPQYTAYTDAMELLEKDDKSSWPFGPLPKEMPERQKGAAKDDDTRTNVPEKDKDLTFTAAQTILSFLELAAE